MSNVSALNKEVLSPRVMAESILEDSEDYEEMYVVAVTKEGDTVTWSNTYGSKCMKGLFFASGVLFNLANKYFNGDLIEEG